MRFLFLVTCVLHFQTTGEKYTPSWVKFKYGAWYLKPKSWKKRNANEPLQDPKELEDKKESEAKKKSNAMVRNQVAFGAKLGQSLHSGRTLLVFRRHCASTVHGCSHQ